MRDLAGRIQKSVAALIFALLGSVIVLSGVYALSIPGDWQSRLGVGLTVYLVFSAVACGGGLLGFVFGMPRGRFADGAMEPGAGQASGSSAVGTRTSHFLVNSNLIKVSDWLTTILLGLGLVNLKSLIPASEQLIDDLAPILGGVAYSGVVGLSFCVIGLISGFLLGYLWTSLKYRQLLEESEGEYSRGVPDLVGKTVAEAQALVASTPLTLSLPQGAGQNDQILSQAPAAGERAQLSADVSVTV